MARGWVVERLSVKMRPRIFYLGVLSSIFSDFVELLTKYIYPYDARQDVLFVLEQDTKVGSKFIIKDLTSGKLVFFVDLESKLGGSEVCNLSRRRVKYLCEELHSCLLKIENKLPGSFTVDKLYFHLIDPLNEYSFNPDWIYGWLCPREDYVDILLV